MQHDTHDDGRTDRRTYLKALGAGTAAIAAFSGVGQARIARSGSSVPSPATPLQQASSESVHPVYGFAAPSPDVEPPVEPDHEVQALNEQGEGFFFEPTGLAIEPGDTVKFTMTMPHHNVVAYHPGFGFVQRVPDGVPPFSGPLLPQGGYWLYTFEQEGVYEMNCAPHEIFGMVMRIVAGSASGPAANPLPDLCAGPPGGEGGGGSEGGGGGGGSGGGGGGGGSGGGESEGLPLRPPELTAYTVLTDSALAPDTILNAGSVSWDDLAPESKQIFLTVEGYPPCGDSDGAPDGDGNGSSTGGRGGNGKAKQGNGKAKRAD